MNKQSSIVVVLVASFALWGVLEGVADNHFTKLGRTLSFVHIVLISALLFWWATLDAVRNNYTLSAGWKSALVLLGLGSMPFFLYSKRPQQRRWWSVAKGFGLVAAAFLLYLCTYTFVTQHGA